MSNNQTEVPTEIIAILNTWIAPKGLITNEASAAKLVNYIFKLSPYWTAITHSNLSEAVRAISDQLDWEKPVVKPRPVYDNIGAGSIQSRRSHITAREEAEKAAAERKAAEDKIRELTTQGIRAREGTDMPTIYNEKTGRVDWRKTEEARRAINPNYRLNQ